MFISIFLILLILVGGIIVSYKASYKSDTTLTIILSPHFDDAVLSLGGLMSKHEHPTVVATFFTEVPSHPRVTDWDAHAGFTSQDSIENIRIAENSEALKLFKGITIANYDYADNQYGRDEATTTIQSEISKDIQALIAAHADKTINVYGPAVFTKNITHPDHQILHDAYIDVARNYPQVKVHFYVYEDYPYTERFTKESLSSLQNNLEKDSGLLFEKETISLTQSELHQKISSLKKYASQIKAFTAIGVDILKGSQDFTNNRCGAQGACEVVYKLPRY